MTSDLTAPTTPTPAPDLGRPPRLRLLVGAACAPAMLLALLATGPLDPFDDGASPAAQLRQVAGHESVIGPLGWLEILAALFGAGMVLSFTGLTRGRGRGLGNAGAVTGVLGTAGLAPIGVHHWALGASAQLPYEQGAQAVNRLDAIAGPAILPLFFAMPVAMVLFALAGHRAGFVPTPALGLVGLFFVTDLVPGLPGGELVQLLIGLIGFVWIAVEVVRPRP